MESQQTPRREIQMEWNAGHIAFATLKAERLAILEDAIVHFKFNEVPHTITPEEARKHLTPDHIRGQIEILRQQKDEVLVRALKHQESLNKTISDELDFARKVYPNEFPIPPKTLKEPYAAKL